MRINAFQDSSLDTDEVAFTEGNTPKHTVILRSLFDLPKDFTLDLTGRYVSRLSQSQIPDYIQADVRVGWKYTKNLELSLVGQNLLDSAHSEFVGNLFGQSRIDIERAFYGKVMWNF
jgi:iron complex outermembrane receptor protein